MSDTKMPETKAPDTKTSDTKTSDTKMPDTKTPDTKTITNKCTRCGKDDAKPCDVCGNALYCNDQCKDKDAKLHNLLCEQFKNFQEKDRPSRKHVRCIMFPVDGSGPFFQWIEHERASNAPTTTKEFIGGDYHLVPETVDTHLLQIFHRSNFLCDGSWENESIAKLVGPLNATKWRGPMFALVVTQLDYDDDNFEEMVEMAEDDNKSMDENLMFREDCDTVTLQRVADLLNRYSRPIFF